jgi:hypothetical protein
MLVADITVALLRGLVAIQGGMCEDAVAHRRTEGSLTDVRRASVSIATTALMKSRVEGGVGGGDSGTERRVTRVLRENSTDRGVSLLVGINKPHE